MASKPFEPRFIDNPIKLLAAAFVAVIILDGGFLTAARFIESPGWVVGLLVIAAILIVPLVLGGAFFLVTHHRVDLQDDRHYANFKREERKSARLAQEQLLAHGFSLQNLALGRTVDDVPDEDARQNVKRTVDQLSEKMDKVRGEPFMNNKFDPDTILVLAQGLMAEKKWLEAGKKFEEYAQVRPEDWEANYLRGVAFANVRGGPNTDLAAVRAYNDAIAFAPRTDTDSHMLARLFSYRAGILKRLMRLDEAEADLHIAEANAREDYEIGDIKYNLAAVYALGRKREKLLEAIQDLQQVAPEQLSLVRGHLDDYFRPYADDAEFRKAIGAH